MESDDENGQECKKVWVFDKQRHPSGVASVTELSESEGEIKEKLK